MEGPAGVVDGIREGSGSDLPDGRAGGDHPRDEVVPSHLGGHQNKTHIDAGALRYVVEKFRIESMLDIGCGPGDMAFLAQRWDIYAIGIDGDVTVRPDVLHDYTLGRTGITGRFDLAWSVEFLEHVEAQYIPNFMPDFQRCKYALVTFAPPGKGGHHHVNCQPTQYWTDTFGEYGLKLDFDITLEVRRHSTMRKPFMQHHGLFFRNVRQLHDNG